MFSVSVLLVLFASHLGFMGHAQMFAENSLQGRWRLLEFACIDPAGRKQVLAPGYPGSKEEWVLEFDRQEAKGGFRYSSEYIGLLNEDCRLSYSGAFEVLLGPSASFGAPISGLRLTPQRASVHQAGHFPVPCQLFPTQRSQKFEARFEYGVRLGPKRLRLRGGNPLKRCQGANDATEYLFELF